MSYLKQTLTLGVVTPTVIKTPQEVDRAKVVLAAEALVVEQAVAETVQLLNIHLKEK